MPARPGWWDVVRRKGAGVSISRLLARRKIGDDGLDLVLQKEIPMLMEQLQLQSEAARAQRADFGGDDASVAGASEY